ncbi:AMP-binding protein [Tahibacter amnicola]|uniref:AMP-binding protein n=1 Tax=Tahibacter amnicola TaxID=2976241 RepID=A0ABY6BEF0_9GAMM|nr:AMP-binding protein [Tahibacter amnicola]UXI66282.1 AMP-binding protein [Tahibacter amnicola]
MTSRELPMTADLIERARLQKAVMMATTDAAPGDMRALAEALARAVPQLRACSTETGEVLYGDLVDAVKAGRASAALQQALERDGSATLRRARALLPLIGVRPGRRFGISTDAASLADLAVALSLLCGGCFVESATDAEVLLCTVPNATSLQTQHVLVFGAVGGIRLPGGSDACTWWLIEESDGVDVDLFAVQRRGNEPAVAGFRELRPYAVAGSDGAAVADGVTGLIVLGTSTIPVRARRLPDGRIEILARHGGMTRINGGLVDIDALIIGLSQAATVRELQVVARADSQGIYRLVVYYAVGEGVDTVAVRIAMDRLAQTRGLSLSQVSLPRLPRDDAGEVDIDRLSEYPVLDEHEISRTQSILRERCNASTASLTVIPAAASTRPVLLAPPPVAAEAAIARPGPDAPPSLIDGGTLVVPDAVPMDLRALLQRAAAIAPEQGLLCISTLGESALSYVALDAQASRDATLLCQAGIRPGQRVVVHCREPLEIIRAFWACVYARAVPCMGAAQQVLAEESEQSRVLGLVQRLSAHLVITAPAPQNPALVGPALVLALEDGTPTPFAAVHEEVATDADAVALIMLTSGSTRLPKLVPQSHRALVSHGYASGTGFGLGVADVSLNWMPLDHVGALVMFHLRDVQLMCRQIHVAKEHVLSDPLRWLDLIERYRVSVSWAPNFAFAQINARLATQAGRRWDLSSLRFLINAGEAVMPDVTERLLALCAPFRLAPDVMKPAWGMSETCSLTVIHRATHAGQFRESAMTAVGTPIPGLAVRIVDVNDVPVPRGTAGALQVRGVFVLQGYLGEDAGESFTTDGWFRTGDLAQWGDRGLTIVGRDKDVVIVNGRNISCQAVEHAVGDIAGVDTPQTTATTYRPPGAVSDQVAVFVVPTGTASVDALSRAVRERLRDALQVDALVVPVQAQDIPRTQIGKAQRGALQKRLAAGEFSGAMVEANSAQSALRALPPWFFASRWVAQQGRPTLPLPSRRWIVVAPSNDVADRACRWLVARGDSACVTDAAASPSAGDGVLVILPGPSDDAARAADRHALRGLGWLDPAANTPLLLVSSGLWDGNACLDTTAACGAIAGIVRSVRQERPQAPVCWTDVPTGADIEQQLAAVFAEFSSRADEPVVRLHDRRRAVQRLGVEAFATNAAPSPLRQHGRYIVTGAGGDLGRLVCEWLRSEWNAHVVGVGRSIPASWAASESCRFIVADVASPDFADAMAPVLEDDEPVDGVFHLAGEFSTAALAELDESHYCSLTRAKREGTLNLLALLRRHGRCDARSVLVLFGSVNSHFGAAGAAAYAAACASQAAIADRLGADSAVDVRYLGWSQWKGLGLSRRNALAELSANRGFLSMDAEAAMQSLHRALSSTCRSLLIGLDAGHLRVLRTLVGPLHDPQVRAELTVAQPQAGAPAQAFSDPFGNRYAAYISLLRAVEDGVESERQLAYQQVLRDIWQDVIGAPLQDIDRNFFESGGSSLRLMQVKSRVEERCGRSLEITDLFRFPTVRSLAAHLASFEMPAAANADVADPTRERAALRRQSRVQGRGGHR